MERCACKYSICTLLARPNLSRVTNSTLYNSIVHKKGLSDEKDVQSRTIEKFHLEFVRFEKALQDLHTQFDETIKSTASIFF